MASYNTLNYMEQGGAVWQVGGYLYIKSNANLVVEAGGALNIETSGAVQLNGTEITNKLYFLNYVTPTGGHTVVATGAASANALLIGRGTSADPVTTSTAGKVFLEFRTETTATSGDSRCLYIRHALNGAGVSGEAIRAFSKITAVAATARGAHISLDLDTENSKGITGLGAGVDAQILVGNGAAPAGGTYAAVNAEIYSAGASSDMGAVTDLSFFRVSNGGHDTGQETVDDDAKLFSLYGFTAGGGHLLDSTINTTDAQIDHTLKVYVDGLGVKYIGLMDNADGS